MYSLATACTLLSRTVVASAMPVCIKVQNSLSAHNSQHTERVRESSHAELQVRVAHVSVVARVLLHDYWSSDPFYSNERALRTHTLRHTFTSSCSHTHLLAHIAAF